MNILKKEPIKNKLEDNKNKLPFAVFVSCRTCSNQIKDYKQIFADIVSDRIKEKYK